MAIGTDFEIQNDKDIRYVGSTTNYTVYELHQWLGGLADDASSISDDFMDMSRPTPSEKAYYTIITLLNGYNVDDAAAEHLYDGSIIQDGGDEIYDGIQVLAPDGTYLQIIQNGALATNFWTTGLNADAANGISHQFVLKVRTAGADIDGRRFVATIREWFTNFGERKINGTSRGVNVVALPGGDTDLNNTTASATVSGWTGITNVEGYANIDVDNNSTDEYYYSEWNTDQPTYTINQFYERMKYLVQRGTTETLYGLDGDLFRGITHDVVIGSGTGTWVEPESCSWTGGTGQLLAVDSTAGGSTTRLFMQLLTGVAPSGAQTITGNGSATGVVSGTPTERTISAPFCGVSTGTSLIGAYGFGVEALDLGDADKVFDLENDPYQAPNYVTFIVGGMAYPTEDYVLVGPRGYRFFYDNEATGPFTVGETLTFTTPAGTAVLADLLDLGDNGEMFIGPMLTGVAPTDDSTIAGTTATADVKGTVKDDIDLRQLTLNGLLNGGAIVTVTVNEVIPVDTPATGTIRIKRTSGKYTRHPYSAWNSGAKTFTITSHDFSGDTAPDGNQVYISYIDMEADSATESFQGVYDSDRALFIRVRNGHTTAGVSPIKTFETTGVLGSAGGSATAVRTSDA